MAGGKAASLDRFARQQAVGSPIIITTPNPTRLEKTQPFCACEKQVLPSPLSLITAHGKKMEKRQYQYHRLHRLDFSSSPRYDSQERRNAICRRGGNVSSLRLGALSAGYSECSFLKWIPFAWKIGHRIPVCFVFGSFSGSVFVMKDC